MARTRWLVVTELKPLWAGATIISSSKTYSDFRYFRFRWMAQLAVWFEELPSAITIMKFHRTRILGRVRLKPINPSQTGSNPL